MLLAAECIGRTVDRRNKKQNLEMLPAMLHVPVPSIMHAADNESRSQLPHDLDLTIKLAL